MEISPLPVVHGAASKPTAPSGNAAARDQVERSVPRDAFFDQVAHLRSLGNTASSCGWSRPGFTVEEVFHDPQKADAFVQDYLQREAAWFTMARNPRTFLTRDGFQVDAATGTATAVRDYSAPSKESLDIGLCVKALTADPRAAVLVGGGDPAVARTRAASILAGKMDTFEKWHRDYPGYGGFMPWFVNGDNGVEPTDDWMGHCPGLDNGEWAWSMLVAERALRDQGFVDLADRYERYNGILQSSAARMWYDPEVGGVRGDVRIIDPKSADTRYETIGITTGEHGVHEGQMHLLYVTLMSRDAQGGRALTDEQVDRVWDGIHMKRVEHEAGTTWQGFWGSPHESWAYLFLPYRDLPEYRDLFRLREVVRSQNAAERGYPGLAASTNAPDLGAYYADCGIEDVGTQPVRHNDVFAVYGAFPMLLEFAGVREKNYGLAWLDNMLRADHMYGPLGGMESGSNDGRKSAMVKTIDGSMPNLLALMGGLERETAEVMRAHGVYDRFTAIVLDQYHGAFGDAPLREPKGFALPPRPVPTAEG